MYDKHIKATTSLLGEVGLEQLKKAEIFKPMSNTSVDPEEIRVALEIVPRTIL